MIPSQMTPSQQLLAALQTTLEKHPDGLSELALMNILDADPDIPFAKPDMRDSWALFQGHFWLFHHLYLLQIVLAEGGQQLDIRATRIQIVHQPRRPSGTHLTGAPTSQTSELANSDPLRAYYLDLSELERETPAGVEAKLNGFWQRLVTPERTQEDWATLEMAPTQSASTVRAQYRRLCQRHHPDRGGDSRRFQSIQAAYARLRPLTG